jgi:hypothetical protein
VFLILIFYPVQTQIKEQYSDIMQHGSAKGATFLPHPSFSPLGILSFVDTTFVTFWWKKWPFFGHPLKFVMEE